MPRPPAPLHLSRHVNIMADDGGMASTKAQYLYFFVFGINLGTKMVANMDNIVYLCGVNIKVYRYDNSKCKRFLSQSRKVFFYGKFW